MEYAIHTPPTIEEILARREGERKPASKFVLTEGGIMELAGKYGTKEELKTVSYPFLERWRNSPLSLTMVSSEKISATSPIPLWMAYCLPSVAMMPALSCPRCCMA